MPSCLSGKGQYRLITIDIAEPLLGHDNPAVARRAIRIVSGSGYAMSCLRYL
ncbi:hypothetical protein MLPF_0190 [Mycobacterium lepromatosis]|nr:hypothetical protein MLPF_0190 [Mycobacterium lepromatosis]